MMLDVRHLKAMGAKRLSLRQTHYHRSKMMGGLFGIKTPSWLKDGFNAVAGLVKAMGDSIKVIVEQIESTIRNALEAYVETLKEIGRTINLVALVAIGKVPLSKVFDSLGKIFRNVGNYLVITNPLRLAYNFLKESPLTAHAFNELDKFTGGMLTNVVNISDLPYRAMRGDPISKQELIKDIMTIVQIASIVVAGPAGIGLFVGNLVGREVCKNQTQAQEACRAAFSILGAATGQWIASNMSYLDVLSNAGEDYIRKRGVDDATLEIARLCQRADMAGNQECRYIGQVVANYIVSDSEEPFEDFLVKEIKRIAVREIVDSVLELFPDNHPAKRRVKYEIVYRDIAIPSQPAQASGTGVFLLLAGGATLFLLGAS